jgi:hypothetical protein
MKITCKNCGTHFEGNYCYNCGQSADTHKLNSAYLRQNLHGLLFKYFHKGILYTSKQLLTKPGDSVRGYLAGKRVNHFDPISLLITFAALYGLLYHTLGINLIDTTTVKDTKEAAENSAINAWIIGHYALVTCTTLPFLALGSYLCFRKQGYNFVEHIVFNAFFASQRMLVHLATIPIQVMLNNTHDLHKFLNGMLIIDLGLLIWSYCQLFNKLKTGKVIRLTFLTYVLFIISYMSVVMLILILLHIVGVL